MELITSIVGWAITILVYGFGSFFALFLLLAAIKVADSFFFDGWYLTKDHKTTPLEFASNLRKIAHLIDTNPSDEHLWLLIDDLMCVPFWSRKLEALRGPAMEIVESLDADSSKWTREPLVKLNAIAEQAEKIKIDNRERE